MWRAIFCGLLMTMGGGCAASAVPKINDAQVYQPRLVGLHPRELSLEVVDRRDPLPEKSAEIVVEVQRAVRQQLVEAGLSESDDAGNSLLVEIHEWDARPQNFPRKYCISLKVFLSTPGFSRPARSEGGACFATKHLLTGLVIGGDPSGTYEASLSTALQGIDEALSQTMDASR